MHLKGRGSGSLLLVSVLGAITHHFWLRSLPQIRSHNVILLRSLPTLFIEPNLEFLDEFRVADSNGILQESIKHSWFQTGRQLAPTLWSLVGCLFYPLEIFFVIGFLQSYSILLFATGAPVDVCLQLINVIFVDRNHIVQKWYILPQVSVQFIALSEQVLDA